MASLPSHRFNDEHFLYSIIFMALHFSSSALTKDAKVIDLDRASPGHGSFFFKTPSKKVPNRNRTSLRCHFWAFHKNIDSGSKRILISEPFILLEVPYKKIEFGS